MTAKTREGFNLNTVLLSILLALSAWTLKTVVAQGETLAATTVRVDYQGRTLDLLGRQVQQNSQDIGALKPRSHTP